MKQMGAGSGRAGLKPGRSAKSVDMDSGPVTRQAAEKLPAGPERSVARDPRIPDAGRQLEDALVKLKGHGVRLTPQRQEVLRILIEEARDEIHFSAEEIWQKVRLRYDSISFDTIYRTLHLLTRCGLASELDFADGCRRFEYAGKGHHHHLVCLKCGRAEELPFCPEECLARVRAERPGFKVAGHAFKVYGYCHRCQKGGEDLL
ncbi:Fur family transcriptional regulator [Desulfofundulus thermobenzoicus]|nr:transcriptional repressor [Desulfofundulus thermobenzoicus]